MRADTPVIPEFFEYKMAEMSAAGLPAGLAISTHLQLKPHEI